MKNSKASAVMKQNEVDGSPSKAFFVSMLTRDIELNDAILDLLDNCVDGVVRSVSKKSSTAKSAAKPYKGYHAHLTINEDRFEIVDNCGGIPMDIAVSRAFRLGRPSPADEGLATVGKYGIGMKRAIFKMSESASVTSKHRSSSFRVDFTSAWLNSDTEWRLPMQGLEKASTGFGTSIVVDSLRPEVAVALGSASFESKFIEFVGQHYALIINKGFEVTVNGNPVPPAKFEFLTSKKGTAGEDGLAPYVSKFSQSGVSVEIYAGLYRELPTEPELDEERETTGSKDDAGWTIVCNDRVVLYRDKTRLSGWGDHQVPQYHSQFIAISGIVFLSGDADALPLTTTKRGIDTGSEIFFALREQMAHATRFFTGFTNRWKRRESELEQLYLSSERKDIGEIIAIASKLKYVIARGPLKAKQHVPSLPKPYTERTDVRISFVKPISRVRALGLELLGETDAKPADVGAAAFDKAEKKPKGGR